MFRFSCFQAHTHSNKHKKTIQPSAEAMKKTLEDASEGRVPMGFSSSAAKDKPCLKEAGDIFIGKADHVADCSHNEGDSKSKEMESECNSFRDIADSQKALIKKSQSLGSGLNWNGRTSGAYGSEDETEHGFYYDGSAGHSGLVVADRLDHHGINPPDQFQGPMPSDSIRVNSDFAKNNSIFSIGDLEHSEIEITDKGDIHLSGSGDSGDQTPHIPPVIVKSSSLPSMGSPNRLCRSPLPRSRSAEDLNALDSRKNGMGREVGRRVQTQARDDPFLDYEKNHDEIPVGDSYESYNYVESAKDWIIPAPDGVNMGSSAANKETSYHHGDEFSPQNFRLKRIEEWVIDLQHRGPFEQFDQFAPSDDHDLPKGNDFLEEPTVTKLEVKVNPGMDAAKRYISSLNASATAAQLTNLGLVMIPFFSAFGSLKALNLSGNAIVRITAGALPRGLHILNISKNNISSIEGLRDLTRIRVLDLSYNRILRIGHGLAGCSSIKELYLAGNKISEVEGLHRLLKLNVLDLRYNKISTAKCLGQLAANYNSLQALSLEGNPAQKNVGDEQLKKYVQSLLPHLTYYNRQSIKIGTVKDTSSDRSARGLRVEAKATRKGTHGIVAQKVSSSSSHGRKTQVVASQRISSRSRHGHGRPLPPSGNRTNQVNKLLSLRNDSSLRRSRSEGTLGAL